MLHLNVSEHPASVTTASNMDQDVDMLPYIGEEISYTMLNQITLILLLLVFVHNKCEPWEFDAKNYANLQQRIAAFFAKSKLKTSGKFLTFILFSYNLYCKNDRPRWSSIDLAVAFSDKPTWATECLSTTPSRCERRGTGIWIWYLHKWAIQRYCHGISETGETWSDFRTGLVSKRNKRNTAECTTNMAKVSKC